MLAQEAEAGTADETAGASARQIRLATKLSSVQTEHTDGVHTNSACGREAGG